MDGHCALGGYAVIDLDMIEAEIDRLELRPTSFYTCRRLSTLYNVRDHILADRYPKEVNASLKSSLSGSEFLDAANGKPYEDVLKVVNEHLDTIKMLYPKTYDGVIQRIRDI